MDSPAFGQADLSNCERELIHLAGSVQPHGALLVLDDDGVVLQCTDNVDRVLGRPVDALLGQRVEVLGEEIRRRIAQARGSGHGAPTPLRCRIEADGDAIAAEGAVHCNPAGAVIVELEPTAPSRRMVETVDIDDAVLLPRLSAAVEQLTAASTITTLSDGVVRCVRDLTGYDRVMVYRFDADGHGKIIAESRHPRLDPLLGHHYPASDIPQRARELYVRSRVRVLADVHYRPSPLVPRLLPTTGEDLDMSLAYLRSMSPLHLQYLKNMGVTATLVASLVREGRLWGLIACHHYAPRNLSLPLRAACEMLAEIASTRIAAVENYAHAQVAMLVRRLEQRLVEATSSEGDWRQALLRNPHHLLQPLEATGAVLYFDGEILTAGDVPSTPELRALGAWIGAQSPGRLFACSSVARADARFDSLTPTASGVLAVPLSRVRPDYLVWLRKEQLQTVTWAGDPTKPALASDDPLQLSPRRSFAAWSEIVRGTAQPWSSSDLALARAIGTSLVDIIVQVNAVRLLIGEHQLLRLRASIDSADEPVLIADAAGRVLYRNQAFDRLGGGPMPRLADLVDFSKLFADPQALRAALSDVGAQQLAWRGEQALRRADGDPLPVLVRAEVVPGTQGAALGYLIILTDLTDAKRALSARRQLEQSLADTATAHVPVPGADAVVRAIVANAGMAAMDIADGMGATGVAPLLEELEASTRRAAALYAQVRRLLGEG